jgi:hypothetical protein
MMPSSALPVWAKNTVPKTSVAAEAYRKNSYHSTTVPAIEAVTTRRRLDAVGSALASRTGAWVIRCSFA